jgi:hypothetical protein
MLTENEKQEIIGFVDENLEGESICDESDDSMVVFTFENDRNNQCLIGTETVMDLLKRGFFLLYAGNNDENKFEICISDANTFRG